MEKNTKIAIGLLAVAGIAYFVYKSKKPQNKANAAGSKNCVFVVGNELVNGRISSYDPNICVSGSQKGRVYSEQMKHDILV